MQFLYNTVKPVLRGTPKDQKLGFKTGYRLMQVKSIAECSIKLPFVFETFVLSFFEWPLKAGFTVHVSGSIGTGGYGKPDPDSEGERILEYALAYDLFLGNTCFKKRDSHLITYRSGNTVI